MRRIIPAVVAVLLLTLLLALGFWQLDRAAQKRELLAAWTQALAAVPQTIDAVAQLEALPRYRRVRLHGRYDSARQALLDAQVHAGRVGYRVWTPLVLESGGTVLVDRGWVVADADRRRLPDVSVAGESRLVTGMVVPLPRPGLRLGNAAPNDESWPRRLLWPDAALVGQTWGASVPAHLVLLQEGEPDGHLRAWEPAVEMPPERHLGYAVQWFGLALALVVICLVLMLRRKRTN